MYWKRSNPHCNGNRRDKVPLKTNCIKNVKFRIIKIRASWQYIGYIYYSENLNWAAQKPLTRPHAARGVAMTDLDHALVFCKNRTIGCR